MAQAVLDFSRVAGKARAVGARRRNGLAMRTLAWQARWCGDFDRAETLSHRAIARLKGEGAESAIADAFSTLAVVHCARGRRDLAREAVEQGFDHVARQPNDATRFDLLITLSVIERHAKRMLIAQDRMREAVSIASGPELARAEQSVARSLLQEDLPHEALDHATKAVDLAEKHRNRVVLPYALQVKAGALIALGHVRRASDILSEAETVAEEDGDRRIECHLILSRMQLKMREGDREAAIALAYKGQDITSAIGYHVCQKNFLDCIARMQEEEGRTEAALRALKQLVALREAERE